MSEHPANRLANETSPYLLQHAHNPVDWHPWGPKALELARSEDKPIFLSIGYSACHWCHVMERESFENEETAALMNEGFVNIKVDREERPDLDDIYMKAVQAMTGAGGWPMSVFLTPDLQPFFGGTYFPPRSAHGRPGFPDLLLRLRQVWAEKRKEVLEQGGLLAERIAEEGTVDTRSSVDPSVLDAALSALQQSYDPRWGGFGEAPKFPHAMDVRLLLRLWKRSGRDDVLEMVTNTLDRMAQGGIYDQLAGGFHRYSTDERWLIPHFEKMLYDNALLVPAYLEAFLATGSELYSRIARECCEWMLGEMRTQGGGIASSQDADSEGEEGKFFVWTPQEIEGVLGSKLGARAAAWYGVSEGGNFEHGTSALWRPEPASELARELGLEADELERAMQGARRELLEARSRRIAPDRDDKVLAAWNGLAISALAQAYQVLGIEDFLEGARSAARFVLEHMRQADGKLFATARGGRAHLNGYLDDYVFMIAGLLDLYESDFDPEWIRQALELESIVHKHFRDEKLGGYYTTSDDHEQLIARLKNPHDGALPAGNGVHALSLLRLAELTGRAVLGQRSEATIKSLGGLLNRYPQVFSQLLQAVDFLAAGPREVVVAGDPDAPATRAMLNAVRGHFAPQRVVALSDSRSDEELMPLLSEREAGPTGARAYVCRNYACGEPADTPEDLLEQLD